MDFEAAAGMTEDELLLALGRELVASDEKALPASLEAMRLRARVWLKTNENGLQNVVCTSPKIKHLATHNDGELAAAIVDVILGAYTGVSPVTVAMLLTKRGVASFCKQRWLSA